MTRKNDPITKGLFFSFHAACDYETCFFSSRLFNLKFSMKMAERFLI